MKFRHLMYPLALWAGYNHADIMDIIDDPFAWSLQPPAFIHSQETKNGMISVMKWKRWHMQEASRISTSLPVDAKYDCRRAYKITVICDFR